MWRSRARHRQDTGGRHAFGQGRYLTWIIAALAGLCVVVVIGTLASKPRVLGDIDARRNPFPPTEESLAIGEQVYRAHCQACHGIDGSGDGPAAATLLRRPPDFWVHFASGHTHTDGRLYYWIAYGMQGTGMPAFRGQLSEAECWHVVNFIRTFTPTDR